MGEILFLDLDALGAQGSAQFLPRASGMKEFGALGRGGSRANARTAIYSQCGYSAIG